MLALTWVLNSTAVAAIQFILLNDFVNQSRISQLEHMFYKTGYSLSLLHQSSIVVKLSIRHAYLEAWSNVKKCW